MTQLSRLKAGDILMVEEGLDCAEAGAALIVEEEPSGLFVRCRDGQHFLDGQTDDDGALIGLRKQNERDRSKIRTRQKVLDAATDLFASEGGYEKATIRSIANAAGTSTGAVFANWKDKVDLYRTIHGHKPITPETGAKLLGLLEVMLHDSPESAGTSLAVANAEKLIQEVRA